jgi:hypothetical protein
MFVANCLEQDDAYWDDGVARMTRLLRELWKIRDELASREGDHRRALLPLLSAKQHPQVRYRAAAATLALAPVEARKTLVEIDEVEEGPRALDVGFLLSQYDQGRYVPK